MRRPSDSGRSVFWCTPFIDNEQATLLLNQWRDKASSLDNFFGDQKRYVFPQLELFLEDKVFIPKVYNTRKLSQQLISLAFSEAERNCATQTYLFDKAVSVPMPAGVLNTYKNGWLVDSIFFQEKLPPSYVAYKEFLKTLRSRKPKIRGQFFSQLGRELGRLHALGVYTEDTDQNMVVEILSMNEFRFHFFDFDNFYPWRYPNLRRTAHAFRHYADSKHYTCSPEELQTFLNSYLGIRNKRQWQKPIIANLKTRKPQIFST